MKRALLIAGGTVGGLGAVLSITPPQLGSQGMTNLSSSANGGGNSTTTASAASSQTAKAVVPQTTSNVLSASASSAKTSVAPKATVKKSTKVVTKKATATTTKKTTSTKPAVTTNAQAPASTPTVAVATNSTAPAPVTKKVSGTFVGSAVFVNYGNVQVEITVLDGKITDARALQAPTGRSDRFTQYAVPVLRQQTLAAQSAHIQGASGASYTSYGWYTSLQVALAKAGL